MGLQVLDDERPGYAILEFDPAIEALTLSISVHSRLHDSYLGPDGEWQKTPYFFPAERVGGDASSTRYRIGPAIVNHMMAMDQIEVAAEDGRISAETVWENAVPEIFAPSRHRIYRHPAARPESITGTGPVQAPAALKVDPTSDEGRAPRMCHRHIPALRGRKSSRLHPLRRPRLPLSRYKSGRQAQERSCCRLPKTGGRGRPVGYLLYCSRPYFWFCSRLARDVGCLDRRAPKSSVMILMSTRSRMSRMTTPVN
jgi:hypothetical protein